MVVLERDVVVGELSRQALLHVLDQIVLGRRVDDDFLEVGVVLGAGSGLAAAGERRSGEMSRKNGGRTSRFNDQSCAKTKKGRGQPVYAPCRDYFSCTCLPVMCSTVIS